MKQRESPVRENYGAARARRLLHRCSYPEVRLPLFALSTLFALFTGCAEEVACTDLAAASARIDVVGPTGDPLVAELSATDEDGDDVTVECADGADPSSCTTWIVGYEVSGTLHIEATADDGCNTGYGEVDVTVEKDADGCHVVMETATLAVEEWTDLACGE
jgi:hypothetical protein